MSQLRPRTSVALGGCCGVVIFSMLRGDSSLPSSIAWQNLLKSSAMGDAGAGTSSAATPVGVPDFGGYPRRGAREVLPDPDVDRTSLPASVQGGVVVEIIIDERGNVVDERLLTGVDHGVDEKVIATLKTWHFRPATAQGMPIPSKQDVYFHFPS